MLKYFAYHALGFESVKLSLLVDQTLPQAEDWLISLTRLDAQLATVCSRKVKAIRLPDLNIICAFKNATGTVSWDSRINLPLVTANRSINIFVQRPSEGRCYPGTFYRVNMESPESWKSDFDDYPYRLSCSSS